MESDKELVAGMALQSITIETCFIAVYGTFVFMTFLVHRADSFRENHSHSVQVPRNGKSRITITINVGGPWSLPWSTL